MNLNFAMATMNFGFSVVFIILSVVGENRFESVVFSVTAAIVAMLFVLSDKLDSLLKEVRKAR